MPVLVVFLLKVNAALLLFCAGYYLVLRHLTFYTLNRIYLASAILFASAYPEINISEFAQSHQQIAKPVQAIVLNWQAPARKFIRPLSQPNYWYWVEVGFWIGVTVLALRLLTQLYSLYKLYSSSSPAQIHGHRVRVINGKAGPFSFWRSIYINPANHEPADITAILLHEQVHVNEWHTLDILLAELSIIFYWFNPGIWLMKKAIRENIEFITDRKILNKGIDTRQYQYSLVNVSFAAPRQGIVNHFNISTIKKRIIMMNAKRSSKANLTRYAFLVPAVVALLLVFSISKAALVKNNSTYKTLAAVVNKLHNNKVAILSKPSQAPVNLFALKNNAGSFFINPDNADVIYFIDGVQFTKAGPDFPDNMESIYILSPADAKHYFDAGNDKAEVAYVSSENSAAGKAIKEKIERLITSKHIIVNKIAPEVIKNLNNQIRAINTNVARPKANPDTVRKGGFYLSSSHHSDSLNYVINGKKASKAEFMALDTDRIYSIEIMPGDRAGKIYSQADNKNNVLFVTTDDSEEGKIFKRKIDRLNGVAKVSRNIVTISRGNGVSSATRAPAIATGISFGTENQAEGDIMFTQSAPKMYKVRPMKIRGYKHDKDSLTIINGEPMTLFTGPDSGMVYTTRIGKPFPANPKFKTTTLPKMVYRYNRAHAVKPFTIYSSNFDNETNIEHLSTKMIMIDGKEATEHDLKKLSAADIESMSVKSGDEITQKYGDKAKNGVVFITTKKGEK
jgi:hypothetical protein